MAIATKVFSTVARSVTEKVSARGYWVEWVRGGKHSLAIKGKADGCCQRKRQRLVYANDS